MPTYRFEPVKAGITRRGKCPACGKTVQRSRTFEQTVNPFNRHEDGTPRSRAEIRAAVDLLADAWTPDFRHDTEACSPTTPKED